MKKDSNRHGKHDRDKVQFGGMVTPEFKAIAQLTASVTRCTLMELMTRGVYNLATGAGIMRNNEVVEEHRATISAMADLIRSNLTAKRGR